MFVVSGFLLSIEEKAMKTDSGLGSREQLGKAENHVEG